MFPAFHELAADEIHLEMANREMAELEVIQSLAVYKEVVVGIMDVKSYYMETVDDVADRIRACLNFAPPERLSFAPDCGLSQTARWAAKSKLKTLVKGVRKVRKQLGLGG
jgi:5-methyltetrahydropteroyltriglutamate--homocysteine methyltransferase